MDNSLKIEVMNNIRHWIFDRLTAEGFSETTATYLNMLGLLLALFIGVFIIDRITRRLLRGSFSRIAERSRSNFDDFLVANRVPRNLSHIIPLIILIEYVPTVFADFPFAENIIEKTLLVAAIVLALWIARGLL